MTNRLDLLIIDFIGQITNPVLDSIMPIISLTGNKGAIWIIISLMLLIPTKTRRVGIISLFALLIGYITGELIIKNIVCRVRPFELLDYLDTIIKPPMSYSFPSGHTASSFAAATSICMLGRKAGICAFIWAALIAFSRIYLSVHYLTDIVAGIILGLLAAFAAKLLYNWASKRLKHA